MATKSKSATDKTKKAGFKTGITNSPTPDRIMGQVPQVHSDTENERIEGRKIASRNEPSKRKTETKKPSKK